MYIGGQVGYAWGTGANQLDGFVDDTFVDTSFGGTPNGVIGGGHVGYNYQITGWNWFSSSGVVIGLEGSVDGTSLTNTALLVFPDGTTLGAHSNANIQGSIRGRLGIAWDRVLIFATGGVAFGGFNTTVSDSEPPSSRQPAVRTPALAGRSAAESNMPSPTIGRSRPNTASPISARSGMGILAARGRIR